ncbi:MAG: DUF1667 domain-containing protein [Lachnospiraceae bacterium]|nr:DUF1667 domain-containing protein [Lachnospiraceae bacterium]
MKKELICINCPMGCHLTVTWEEGGEPSVTGNTCKRGEIYGIQEMKEPRRTITCLMKLADREEPLSVKTQAPVPKKLIFSCLNQIYATHPSAPVHEGDVVVEDLCGLGISVVATRNVL